MITALAAQPVLAAAQVEGEAGASRGAVLRNLDLLEASGLVCVVTGQGRFRTRAARV